MGSGGIGVVMQVCSMHLLKKCIDVLEVILCFSQLCLGELFLV